MQSEQPHPLTALIPVSDADEQSVSNSSVLPANLETMFSMVTSDKVTMDCNKSSKSAETSSLTFPAAKAEKDTLYVKN